MNRSPSPALVRALALIALAGLVQTATAKDPAKEARKQRDHEAARAALQRGEILPLARILAAAAQAVPGEVVKVELAMEGAEPVYKLKVLGPDGHLRKARLDARTGALRALEPG